MTEVVALQDNFRVDLRKELPPKRGVRIISQEEALKAAALDAQAIAITTRVTQYSPARGVRISNIINDQFERYHFRGKTILELGPGHYSFSMVARHLGARMLCVDRNPTLLELGRYLGFEVYDMDFYALTAETLGRQVDGLWLKGAFNACYHPCVATVDRFVGQLNKLLAPAGWGWSVTTNKPDERMIAQLGDEVTGYQQARIEAQRAAFVRYGWSATPILEGDRRRYSLKHKGGLYYFTKNLRV